MLIKLVILNWDAMPPRPCVRRLMISSPTQCPLPSSMGTATAAVLPFSQAAPALAAPTLPAAHFPAGGEDEWTELSCPFAAQLIPLLLPHSQGQQEGLQGQLPVYEIPQDES